MVKTTIQDRVLLEVYLKGREIESADLKRITKLGNHQLYRALWGLKQRSFIKKRYERTGAQRRVPPQRKMFIKMRDPEYVRRYLSKRGLV